MAECSVVGDDAMRVDFLAGIAGATRDGALSYFVIALKMSIS